MKKRIICLTLTLCLMFSVLPLTAFASDTSVANSESSEIISEMEDLSETEKTSTIQWEYETYGSGIVLTKYLGKSVDIYIIQRVRYLTGKILK